MASMSVCPKASTRAVFKIFLLLALTFPSPAAAEQPGETSVIPAPGSTVNWPPTDIRILHRSPNSAPAVDIRLLLSSSSAPLHILPSVEVVDGVQLVQVPQLGDGSYTFSYVHNGVRVAQSFKVMVSRELYDTPGSSEPRFPSWLVPAAVGVTASAMFGVLYVVRLRKLSKFRARAYLVSFCLFLAAAGSAFPFLVQNTASQGEEACLPLSPLNRNKCLADIGLDIFSAEGVPAVMLFLEDLDTDPRFVSRNGEHVCHEVSHLVGQKILQSTVDVTASLKGSSGVCALGYIHGVGEAAARHVPTDDVYGHLASLCYDKEVFPDNRSIVECAHGFGHAIAVRTNVSFGESVDICYEHLVGTALEDSCVEAVAMISGEWIANQLIRTESFIASLPRNYPSSDLLLWCSVLESRPSSHAACMSGLVALYKGSADSLAYLPEEYRTPQSLMESCPRLLGASADNCYAASGTAMVYYEPNSTDGYSNLCDSIASSSGQSACYYGVLVQAFATTDNSADQDGFVGSICDKSRDPGACRDEISRVMAARL